MRIAKFGHSCLLVEHGGARLLVDPGSFSDIPSNLGHLDAVLITHAHADHLDEALLGTLHAAQAILPIFACADAVAQLAEKGIAATDHAFAPFEVAGVQIETLESGHNAVLGPVPQNAAYRIGGEFVVTGDSTAVALEAWKGTRVLALPTSAPWATRPALATLVERLAPEVAIPVHDGFLVDTFKKAQDAQFGAYCESRGVRYLYALAGELQEV